MSISIGNLPPQIKANYGILSGLAPTFPTPFRDMFMTAPMLAGTKAGTIKFSYRVGNTKAAELLKKGSISGIKKIRGQYWREVELTPGEIFASTALTATELTQMQPGGNEVWMIGGEIIPTSSQLANEKLQELKDAAAARENIMATQLINNGIVLNSDGIDYIDYLIPAAQTATYSTAAGFLPLVKRIKTDFRKANGVNETDFLIGSDIVDKMLVDSALQQTMFNLGMTNIGKDLTVDEKQMVVGTFMGSYLKQMELSFDADGVQIIAGNTIKLIDRSKFRRGQAPIEIINPTTNLPDIALMDYWTDIEIGTKKNASAELFLKGGFFPIVLDPVAIQTWTITIA